MLKYFRSSALAHEIASAVFRVSALVLHKRLRKELEEVAVGLVKDIHPKNVDTLERLVRLTGAVGQVSEINAMVLCRELGNLRIILNTEIAESISEVSESVDLREIFSGKTTEEEKSNKEDVRNRAERQEAILRYIRKFPNGCRMRQLSTEFANFSERTVRTDVQGLMKKGLIEKIGSKTGPFSYFRVVDSTHSAGSGQANSPQVDSAHSTNAAHSTDSGQADSSQASRGQAESPLPAGRQV